MIDEINYNQKVWNENDVVTDTDLNRIESGISDVTQYANALNVDTNSRLTQLGSDLSNTENKLRTEMNTSDATIEEELKKLKETVAANRTELLGKISDVKNDVVLQSNFESTLQMGIAPLLVTDSTTHLAINGGSLSVERKNTSKNLIKYAYYKRTSTADVSYSKKVTFASERFSLWKYQTFTLATLDEGTSDMTEADLKLFSSATKHSGVGSYSTRFYISNGKLMLEVGLLGGGLISVSLELTVYFRSYNDTKYTSY